ncbi:MAG: anthranilate phosphoribosyltransferase [Armatimonadota bacterium]|nr:MAG: anthranilate phosphoribosyltransferase [Armatimonadota bacterium]
MIADVIRKAADGRELSPEEANGAMTEIMEGEASPVQISAFLVAMRMKGETVEEVTEFTRVMREHVRSVKPSARPLVDTCGTGGDAIKTFNVSTGAAFVAAGAGVAVAKHGNRSVTSKCGSADVLEALGVRFDLPPEEVARCVDEIGLGFMFAPSYHPAMKHAMPVRRELGLRTVFNMLGPLTNPAGAEGQVLGVYSPELTELHAGVLRNLGSSRAFVVHGAGGLDELSTLGETRVTELRDGELQTYDVTPEQVGLARADRPDQLQGGAPQENAELLVKVLEGQKGPARDIVLLNAAAAVAAGGKADTLKEAVPIAAASIDSGAALDKLRQLQAI